MNVDPAPPPIPRRRVKTESRWADFVGVIVVLGVVGLPIPRQLPGETAQPNQIAPSNLRDKVLSALEPEIRSHPDVIRSFHNRAKHLKGKIILIGNNSLLFTEDTFWEFADALLVKKDINLATQKTTQWVKTGGAVLTDEHKYSEGLVKSVDGPFYRFICVESNLQGSKTNFWLSIGNVSRRSPTDFALAINQYQKPLGSDTEDVVSGHVRDAFSCVYHFSDGGLNGDEIFHSGQELEAALKADQDEKDKSGSESSPSPGENERNTEKIDVKQLVDDLKGVTTSTNKMNSEESQQSTDETLTYIPSPTPTPRPNTRQPSRTRQTGRTGAGEPIYPSQPVGAAASSRKTKAELEAYRRTLEQDWDKEVARREKEEAQSDHDKARELYLQKRLGRPPGAHWGIEEDEFWRHVLGLDHE